MAKVEKTDGCWIWRAYRRPTGYGAFGIGAEVDYAHRVAYRLFVGEIPAGMHVCHRCDVRECVRPDHLFVGTRKDNMRDAAEKGRIRIPPQSFASDETHQPAKLTNDQVREIRATDTWRQMSECADRFGVSESAAWMAKTRRTFRDVA